MLQIGQVQDSEKNLTSVEVLARVKCDTKQGITTSSDCAKTILKAPLKLLQRQRLQLHRQVRPQQVVSESVRTCEHRRRYLTYETQRERR